MTHVSGLGSEDMTCVANMWLFFSLFSMNSLTEIIDFFSNFEFIVDVTMFTMSLTTPTSQKSQEIGLDFLYHENPVSCYHVLYII